MQAMILERSGQDLTERTMPDPIAGDYDLLLEVKVCGVCRTDLHILDGELSSPKLPLVLGHEIVGKVIALGAAVKDFQLGDRVGVPWLGGSCGSCRFCLLGKENLCDKPLFTGYQRDGGYSKLTVADSRFCFRLPDTMDDHKIAPLLCAGLIGWRSLKKTGEAKKLGLYGFGAAAHIITQIAKHQGREVYAFTKPGDHLGQSFAKNLGVAWCGGSDQMPPEKLDAAIIFAPAGELIPQALQAVDKGGIVVCGGIHMSPIPEFSYDLLWGERTVCSVANLTRQDGNEFFETIAKVPLATTVELFALSEANRALQQLKQGKIKGAAVLVP